MEKKESGLGTGSKSGGRHQSHQEELNAKIKPREKERSGTQWPSLIHLHCYIMPGFIWLPSKNFTPKAVDKETPSAHS